MVRSHAPPAHRAGGDREEVGPVARGEGRTAELEIGLVHQGGGVERPLHVFEAQLPPRQAAEVVVHQGQEAVQGVALSFPGGQEEAGNFAGVEGGFVHASRSG